MNPLDRFRGLMGRGRLERDIREEMESHIAHRVDELVAEGHAPDDARGRAEREFGDVGRLGDETLRARRAAGGGLRSGMDVLRQDVGFALRQLRRSPGFAILAVTTIGLGIAATTTVAGVVRAVVLEPLPFEQPDRLVLVEEVTPAKLDFSVSEPTYMDWREGSRSFEDIAASTVRRATLTGRGEPRGLLALWASASLLPVLGVEPGLGRGISEEEDAPGARAPVAVLSDRLWRETFGADPGVIGESVVLNGEAHRVIGVLPAGDLSFLGRADVIVPLGAAPHNDRTEHYLDVMARLAPGVSLAAARTEMEALAHRLSDLHLEEQGWSVKLTTARDAFVGPELTRAGWVVMAGAGLLLLIACVNVSNLLLARGATRRAEIGVRAALGAGRGRIVRQLLTESLVLAGLGGALGLVAATVGMPLVRALGGTTIPRLENATVGPTILLTCLGATLLAAGVFGVTPALRHRRDVVSGGLRSGGGRGTDRRRAPRLLVGAQVALSLVLLVGTGLLTRSFMRLAAVDPGFDPEGTLSVRLNLAPELFGPDERIALMRAVLEEVEAVPGVRSAAATVVDPFGGQNLMNSVARADRMPDDARRFLPVAWRIVTPGFPQAMGVELLAGRMLTDEDGWEDDGTPVVVSRKLARTLWPEGDAVGGTLVWGDPDGSRLRIVGVLEEVKDWRLDQEAFPVIYRPYAQIPWTSMTLVARIEGSGGPLGEPLRAAIRRAAPEIAVPEVRPLTRHVSDAVAAPRFHAVLLGFFGVAGLALAGIGVYGVTAFDVSRRFREIGIRLAVGGDPADIRRMVVRDALVVAVGGAAVGAAVAWWASGLVADLLFGITPADPVTWVGGVGALLLAVFAAAWVPSRRATRIAPRDVLAAE